jgi:hypothetical protein
MQRVRQQLGFSGTLAALALVGVMSLVIASCSTQSGNPTSPSATTGGTLNAQPEFKGIVCHATGSGNFVAVEIGLGNVQNPPPFSNNGHLDENGSGSNGHEEDFYLGPSPPFTKDDAALCFDGPPTPTPTP